MLLETRSVAYKAYLCGNIGPKCHSTRNQAWSSYEAEGSHGWCPYYVVFYMQSVRIMYCSISTVSVLFTALYNVSVLFRAISKCPYYVLLYNHSVRIICCFICKESVLCSALYAEGLGGSHGCRSPCTLCCPGLCAASTPLLAPRQAEERLHIKQWIIRRLYIWSIK